MICDLWGCLHNGQVSFKEALKTLNRFRKNGGIVALVTNAPRPKHLVEKQIFKLGINKTHYDALLTSGELTSEFIASKYNNKIKVFHIGSSGFHSVFENTKHYNPSIKIELVTLAEADLIVCTEPFNPKADTIENYKDIFSYGISKNLPLICSNPDLVVDVGEVRELCAGSIANLYKQLGGQITYIGKPFKDIYQKVYNYADIQNDIQRRNRIIQLLLDWGLVSITDTERVLDIAPLNQIKVLAYKEKNEWELETKYNIGKRKKTEETE